MRTYTISSLSKLVELSKEFQAEGHWCFRGQSDARWDLVPSIYRSLVNASPDIESGDGKWITRIERDINREFDRKGRNFFSCGDPWESLCMAQHFGAPTRLLDWTRNIQYATYFAVGPLPIHDAAIWCLNLANYRIRQ